MYLRVMLLAPALLVASLGAVAEAKLILEPARYPVSLDCALTSTQFEQGKPVVLDFIEGHLRLALQRADDIEYADEAQEKPDDVEYADEEQDKPDDIKYADEVQEKPDDVEYADEAQEKPDDIDYADEDSD